MGGHPYWYKVPYEGDVAAAIAKLREREFKAGRYNPVIPFIVFEEPAFFDQHPGAKHPTIEAALEASDADGTRSILDIFRIGDEAADSVASPVDAGRLRELYGTDTPTRDQVMDLEFLEDVDRGQCVYTLIYDKGKPAEVLFAGYSYD